MRLKKLLAALLAFALTALPAGAAQPDAAQSPVTIALDGSQVTVDGQPASTDPASAVYVGGDIVYYRDGTDETYGEGEASEKHSADEAGAHTVVTLTQPGTYRLTGTLTQGQIAVDLGENAKDDPSAVVTLILDNANVTCTVAPALIFYNVYECDRAWVGFDKGENPDYQPSAQVDTTSAGANVILAAGSVNTFQGSHVARIYQEGTTKKLHKYDGAVSSKMSINVLGDNGDHSGVWNIVGDKEGLETALHLTLNGGTVRVTSQDDGVNSSEDNVSVTTVNAGSLTVNAGNGAEGDGIDSNGYLVINGGSVTALASDHSMDGGVDADRDILINGGTVAAFGVRNEAASASSRQPYMELSFATAPQAGSDLELKDEGGKTLWRYSLQKSCQTITLTTPDLALDTVYHLYVDGVRQSYSGNRFGMGGPGGQRPQGIERPADMPQPPEGFDPGQFKGERPDGDRPQPPEGAQWPHDRQRPDGEFGGFGGDRDFSLDDREGAELSADFVLTAQVKSFSGIRAVGETSLPFVDVDETTQGYAAIAALFRSGIVQGDGAGHFFPYDPIQPEHWQLMLQRLAAAGVAVDNAPAAQGMTRSQAAQVAAGLLQG